MSEKHILLVEDDQSLGLTLKERLVREGHLVALARSLGEAREHLSSNLDLVILDVGLPDGSGLEFAKEVRQKISAPFLFVTAQSDAESRLMGYEAGAEEFIPKPFHLKEFLMRVRHVLDNHSAAAVYRLEGGDLIDFDGFSVVRGGARQSLTQKEAQVLKILIEKSPQVISRDDLLNQAWGEEKFPSTRTVDNVILSLRGVLGETYGPLIQSVRGVGYQWIKK